MMCKMFANMACRKDGDVWLNLKKIRERDWSL